MTDSPTFPQKAQVDRRQLLIGGVFLATAGVAAVRRPSEPLDYLGKAKLEDVVPKQIGQWKFLQSSGLVVPPDDQLSQALYSQLLTRIYTDGESPPMMLLVAQSSGQTGVLQIHRPEVCYPAGGYQLSPVTPMHIAVAGRPLPINRLMASADGRDEHILYWTRVGDKLPLSWRDQRIAVAEQNLRGIIPDAVLVRVSTRRNDAVAANHALQGFIESLIKSLAPANRPVFIA